jgi:hypothetical protein
MKKIFTLLSISMGLISFSQIELHKEGISLGNTMSINESTSNSHFILDDTLFVGLDTTINKVYIVNTGTTDELVTFQRVRRYHKVGWTDQVCDKLLCFNADNIDIWNRPPNPPLAILAGDSSVFQPKVYPNGVDGCSIYTYIINSGTFGSFGDSLQVTYTIGGIDCFLGNDEIETSLEYSVYPNPVNDELHISIAENNTSISIFDIIGENVSFMELVNGNNILNIENLNPGVYFCSIKRNGVVIETQKLVIN